MSDDYRELARRLFATATAMLEDATEVSISGQSQRLIPAKLADHGRRLQTAARDVAAVAEAAIVIAHLGQENGRLSRRKQPPR